jgi:site-specific recombinase XerD
MSNRSSHLVDSYLEELAAHAPRETFHSHRTVVKAFEDWCCERETVVKQLDEAIAVQYLSDLITSGKLSRDTVIGYVASLANFLAYARQGNPRLIQKRIVTKFNESITATNESHQELELPVQLKKAKMNSCESLLSYLRKCQFGSRTHAFVELIYDTKSQPGPLLDADIQDIDVANCTLQLSIPETYVVSKTGIVTEWTANFSSDTAVVVEEYLEYERTDVTGVMEEPLFTTTHGRIDESTIRRNIRQASRVANKCDTTNVSSECPSNSRMSTSTTNRSLTPRDVWECAIGVYQGQA